METSNSHSLRGVWSPETRSSHGWGSPWPVEVLLVGEGTLEWVVEEDDEYQLWPWVQLQFVPVRPLRTFQMGLNLLYEGGVGAAPWADSSRHCGELPGPYPGHTLTTGRAGWWRSIVTSLGGNWPLWKEATSPKVILSSHSQHTFCEQRMLQWKGTLLCSGTSLQDHPSFKVPCGPSTFPSAQSYFSHSIPYIIIF